MEKLFLSVLDLSIAASWVILAVLAVRALLYKAPKLYSYALWAAVGFRLVSSVSVSSVVSLFNLRPFREAVQTTGQLRFIPRNIELAAIPQIRTGVPAVDTVVNNNLPAPTPEASVNPMQIVIFVGMMIWIAGMVVMAVISIVNYVRLRRDLRFAVRMEGNVWQCETVRSPFLVGLINPRIYLPYGLDNQTQEYILAHERYHLKRFDYIVKLFAYTLLTIYWFNPLCHLAFRLMNRDMEMSCDEEVLNRNNIPTTQYSLSLLTIATNRRFPAATPLAFAETGVKERMINVLNWKKPKKWVSVVAVMVCAILLISCATNPKASEPKVDNPQLLEFPGIKWGATPEEVKTALGVTEEQICNETDSENASYDEYYCSITNFHFLGEDVSIGAFSFRALPGKELKLYRIMLFLDEDVDMGKMQEKITETYNNEGTGEYYISYTPISDTEWDSETGEYTRTNWRLKESKKGGDPTLNYLARNPFTSNDERAQMMNEAVKKVVEDPDFKRYNWISSVNAAEIMPAEDVEWLRAWHEEREVPWEITQEWMEKAPLVAISMSNRTRQAIQKELEGTKTGELSYATHNQIIFDADVLIYFEDYVDMLALDSGE